MKDIFFYIFELAQRWQEVNLWLLTISMQETTREGGCYCC